MAVGDLAIALLYQDKISRATELLEDHLSLLDDPDDLATSAWFQFTLGSFKVLQGEWEQATALLKKSLLLHRQINHVHFIGDCLIAFAGVAIGIHQPIRAAQLLGARESIHDSIGSNLDPGLQRFHTSFIVQTRAMLDEPAFVSAWGEGRAMTLDEAVAYALDNA